MSTAPGMLTFTVSHPPTVPRASSRRWHGSRLDPRRCSTFALGVARAGARVGSCSPATRLRPSARRARLESGNSIGSQ
eukprot:4254724-Pleurochrysis_carterae.AAC.1